MGKKYIKSFLLIAFVCLASVAIADKVVLQIQVVNKDANNTRVAKIRSYLPDRVTTNDIISLPPGLSLTFDVQSDAYLVTGDVELQPKGQPGDTQVLQIELKDVWAIPEDELAKLESRASDLVAKLSKDDGQEVATELKKEVGKFVEEIRERQKANKIKGTVLAMNHISAYDSNLEVLKKVKKNVRRIENLVLAAGKDPGDLVSDGPEGGEAINREAYMSTNEYSTIIYKLVVKNSSQTEPRSYTLNHSLPSEIRVQDVINSADLLVRKDPRTGLCFLYKTGLQLPPGGELTFNVTIRDRWNINASRIGPLRDLAEMIYEKVAAKGSYEDVEKKVKSYIDELDAIEKEEGPKELSNAYVNFYRRQAERLDTIQRGLLRIKEALTPVSRSTKVGFKAKPPSQKSTWLIIYIILGFLALMSLLFFLRWYGKSGEELMEEGSKGPASEE